MNVFGIIMVSRKKIEKELQNMKHQIDQLSTRNIEIKEVVQEKAKSDETGSNLITLLKYMMDENKKTTMILKGMQDQLNSLIDTGYIEQQEGQETTYPQENKLAKTQPISGLDAQIIQIIQRTHGEMACADDIKKQMSYKGRNAASARLNRLYKAGLLERFQLGHKVYYKFDAGKMTNTLIVSPPQ
jgi:hypothetical protein